ncbi:acyltransferase family protein [Mycolicibacterium fortuitum]|uniref:Acyltransferase n=3 Tax=Mycolicibacterium fortuitum TaxID=1766 RepID=A0AAE5ACG3_MYCFO|nr:acyltransferase [Mycolicibacterium fortuitum]AIY48678.1 acyltransferase [Mycobacterium sp. VKM Ac-1817D]CRL72096.1 acyltransferase [Mycolicibacter nonchromogenicus]AMD56030.1 acyltransferase [Mycolicibacterium fortuitum subsp. fortuitum DSM 46621 = ATCC 6841 = JCM 6387]EJZ13388.1 acyltransferase [Mycolicibacterium fortuitum subsp. fortuitum DSM 46621 = ATCC 6841 = JCM 6387]MCV7140676.1 acyltransferase [Mycolicibacterium fortuitum]
MTSAADDDQGGLEQVSHADRVASLTGVRALAALTVMGTHAAYGTGLLSQGYVGLMSARLEVGVAIFFVLSGLLLFRPWVQAAAAATDAPSTRRYARNRFRRIMPAYVVTVLLVYGIYELRPVQPNPGHTWAGLLRNLTLTQIYSDNYFTAYLHQGLSQMWSLAVEVAFYAVLPLLAYLLLVVLCRNRFRPVLLLVGLAGLAAISPLWLVLLHNTHWLPVGGGAWLPHYLVWFVGGMMLAVLATMGVRCYAMAALPLALACYLVVSTPIAGLTTAVSLDLTEDVAKTMFYVLIATLVVAPLALGDKGLYARAMGSRPMVALGEISYEIFLLHVVAMDLVMEFVLGWHVYTGSATVLFIVTLVATVPAAWLLHRLTRPRGW